jgi:hypothetical protein
VTGGIVSPASVVELYGEPHLSGSLADRAPVRQSAFDIAAVGIYSQSFGEIIIVGTCSRMLGGRADSANHSNFVGGHRC